MELGEDKVEEILGRLLRKGDGINCTWKKSRISKKTKVWQGFFFLGGKRDNSASLGWPQINWGKDYTFSFRYHESDTLSDHVLEFCRKLEIKVLGLRQSLVENRVEAIMEKVTVDETVQGKCAGWKEDRSPFHWFGNWWIVEPPIFIQKYSIFLFTLPSLFL